MSSPSSTLRHAAAILSIVVGSAALQARGSALERIHVSGTQFRTEAGEPVWLNGINTAWMRWNDFGGGRFDPARWDEEFARYARAGINCARVWIDCDGEIAVRFDGEGRVAGPDPTVFDDVQQLLEIAERHAVHVLAVLTSFDHLKPNHPRHRLWCDVFNRDDRLQSYVRNFVEPLAARFADNPALLAWEICNEPEWIWFRRYGVSRDRVVAFHAHVAAALHRGGATAVTTGSASWRWHRNRSGRRSRAEHPWSDASMARHCAEPGARLDFFQVHYYDWMSLFGWSPYARGAGPARFLVEVDRPVIIGETRGRYSWFTRRTVEEAYRLGQANGYAGVFGWSAHGADGHGNFEEIALATQSMAARLKISRLAETPVDVVATVASNGQAMQGPIHRENPHGGSDLEAETVDFERVALLPAPRTDSVTNESAPTG